MFNIKIWLDDVRPAPKGYKWAQSVNEAKTIIQAAEKASERIPRPCGFCGYIENIKEQYDEYNTRKARWNIEVIDCDHDLGDFAKDGGDGIKLLDWLAERSTYYHITLHTMNPVGRQNMQRLIDRYWPKDSLTNN